MQTSESPRPAPNPLVRLVWNARERRVRALLRLALTAVLLVIGTVVFSLLAVLALMPFDPNLPLQGSAETLLLVGAVATLLATLVAVWLAGRTLDRRRFAEFGFHLDRRWWLDLAFGLALGALLMTGIFLFERALGWIEVTETWRTSPPQRPFAQAVLGPLVVFVCVGIYEEIISRGYLLRNLAEGLNLPRLGARGALLAAWLISSAVFGALHAANPNATPLSTVMLVLAGMFLGLGYVLTGELAIPIGLHITWNFFQGSVFGFPVSGNTVRQATVFSIEQRGPAQWTGGAFGPEAGLTGLFAILAGTLLTLLWVRARHGRITLDTRLAHYSPLTPPV
jgi:uncharacterized protein